MMINARIDTLTTLSLLLERGNNGSWPDHRKSIEKMINLYFLSQYLRRDIFIRRVAEEK